MSKIYIVQYYCFDYECEFSENIMAFTTKAEAKEYVSELEKNSKKARELLDNNRKTSEALLAPFRDKFRKKIATKEEIDEYQKIYSEQCTKEQKILTEMTEKYGYFSKNNDEEFIIDELTLHSPTN